MSYQEGSVLEGQSVFCVVIIFLSAFTVFRLGTHNPSKAAKSKLNVLWPVSWRMPKVGYEMSYEVWKVTRKNLKCSVEFQTLPFARRAGEDAAVVAKPVPWYIHLGQLKVALGKSAIVYRCCPSHSVLHELLLLFLQYAFRILAHLLHTSLKLCLPYTFRLSHLALKLFLSRVCWAVMK